MDGLLAEDGDLLYVDHGGMGKRTEGEGGERPMIFLSSRRRVSQRTLSWVRIVDV